MKSTRRFANLARTLLIAALLAGMSFAMSPTTPAHAAHTLDCTTAVNINVPVAECQSLLDLYHDLGGGTWASETNWNTDTDICTWIRITCSGSNVLTINLASNNLSGNIDAVDMSGLTILRWLYLFSNNIGGNIDGFDLTNNTNLRELRLYGNNIGGNIDGFDLTNNPGLSELELNNNNIGGNIDGFDLTNNNFLRVLRLDGNGNIGGNIDGFDLTNNTNLRWLRLNNNSIGGDINGFDLTNNRNLRMIRLQNNQMVGALPLSLNGTTLPNLTDLNLSNNLCLQSSGNATVDAFVTGLDADWQTSNTNCALSATAVCNGGSLDVTAAVGDLNIAISADDPNATNQSMLIGGLGTFTLVSGTGSGTWTNITVTELGGDAETLNLADLTCAAPRRSGSGGAATCPACGGTAGITIDVIPPTDSANYNEGEGSARNTFVLDDTPIWVFNVTNPTGAALDNVVAHFEIPSPLEIVSIVSEQGTASADDEKLITATFGTVQSGQTVAITVTTKVVPVGEGCVSGWSSTYLGDDTECVDIYLLPGSLPPTGNRPVRNILAEALAGLGIVALTGGWMWLRRREAFQGRGKNEVES